MIHIRPPPKIHFPAIHSKDIKSASRFVGNSIVKPVYHDIVKPLYTLPVQIEHDVANIAQSGVRTFSNPLIWVGVGAIAFLILARK